ncbi:MAG: RNA 2',3'-cyclic phosphodiesterase [Candidatus Lokiarchaeota archaeon]|nr:RNA 2',3'-cyclic phosphodiesterase [Candidatus Lokiarchaeota archaeon]
MIRAFIAIELKDPKTLDNIQTFSSRIKQNQPRVKLVKPENLHLTIKFLGDIKEELAPQIFSFIKDEINLKMFKGQTLDYSLKGVGQFNKFTVLWIMMKGDIQFLQNVKETVEEGLYTGLKIPKDKRIQFKPHLTIGRLRKEKIDYKNLTSLKNIFNENNTRDFGPFTINQVKLKKSVLTPQGPIYSDLKY